MRLVFDKTRGTFDLARLPTGGIDPGIGNGGLLEGAVWASIFTDLLADPSDLLPDLGPDRRGWWADGGKSPADSMGSLVWLRMRSKKNETTRKQIENDATVAVQWLLDDGHALEVTVTATWIKEFDGLMLRVVLIEPNGVRRDWKTDLLWSGVTG